MGREIDVGRIFSHISYQRSRVSGFIYITLVISKLLKKLKPRY